MMNKLPTHVLLNNLFITLVISFTTFLIIDNNNFGMTGLTVLDKKDHKFILNEDSNNKFSSELKLLSGPVTNCSFNNVGNTMYLEGDCTTDGTIYIPDGWTLDGQGYTITPVHSGGICWSWNGSVIQNSGTSANVNNLKITGPLPAVTGCYVYSLEGIFLQGASGSLINNTITDLYSIDPDSGDVSGIQAGDGIYIRNCESESYYSGKQSVNITGNTVDGFQKTGIVFSGCGGDGTDADAIVTDNTVIGNGPLDMIGQNGIGIWLTIGSTATVENNYISDLICTIAECLAGDYWSYGMYVYNFDGISISNNVITNVQSAMDIEGDNAIITGNNLSLAVQQGSENPDRSALEIYFANGNNITDNDLNGYDFLVGWAGWPVNGNFIYDNNAGSYTFGEGTGNYFPGGSSYPGNSESCTLCTTDCYVDATGDNLNCGNSGDPFKTIQKGIDTVDVGGNVNVAAGLYNEHNITISKKLKIIGSGNGDNPSVDTILNGTAGTLGQSYDRYQWMFKINNTGGTSGSDRLTIKDLALVNNKHIDGQAWPDNNYGISFAGNVNYILLDNLRITENGLGLYVANSNISDIIINNSNISNNQQANFVIESSASMDNMQILDSHLDNTLWGFNVYQRVTPYRTSMNNLIIKDTTFINDGLKGIYFEKVSNALFENVDFIGCGNNTNYPNPSQRTWAAAIDINLKFNNSYTNLTFDNVLVSNSGFGGDPFKGTGVAIKARDDGGTYGPNPAYLSGLKIVNSNFINNRGGLRFGEPGKMGLSPVDVSVYNTNIYGNLEYNFNKWSLGFTNVSLVYWGSDDNSTIYSTFNISNSSYSDFAYDPFLCEAYPTSWKSTGGVCLPQGNNVTGNISDVETTGITLTNVTVNGVESNSSEIYSGEQNVTLLSNLTPVLEFNFNFTNSSLDLNEIKITKGTNYIIVNVSGIIQPGFKKTVYVTDNNFRTLCVKDSEVAVITEVSKDCNGAHETILNQCLNVAGPYTVDGITCTKNGTQLKIEGLNHSAILGTVSSGGSGGSSLPVVKANCLQKWTCSVWSKCDDQGKQSRTCTLQEDCSQITTAPTPVRPIESQSCAKPIIATCNDGIKNQNEENIDCGGVCEICQVEVILQQPVVEQKSPEKPQERSRLDLFKVYLNAHKDNIVGISLIALIAVALIGVTRLILLHKPQNAKPVKPQKTEVVLEAPAPPKIETVIQHKAEYLIKFDNLYNRIADSLTKNKPEIYTKEYETLIKMYKDISKSHKIHDDIKNEVYSKLQDLLQRIQNKMR